MSQCPSKNDPLQLDKTLTDIFVSLESVKPSEFNDVLGRVFLGVYRVGVSLVAGKGLGGGNFDSAN